MDSVNEKYFQKFEDMEYQYDEYSEFLCSVEIMTDNKLFEHYRKEQSKLEKVVSAFKKYKKANEELELANELFLVEADENEKAKFQANINELKAEVEKLFEETKQVYFEQGSKQNQRIKVEISYKTGDKAFVFEIKNLFEEISRFNDFKFETISESESQISCFVEGENAFENLKFFNGVVRKIQNTNESAALVVVLLEGESEIEFDENDIEIQISKSSGAGGQHINKTESAVKLIHIPTGITAECQDERSQGKNKEKAMVALKEKILQKSKENQEKYIKNQRNSLKNAIFSDTPVLIFDYDRNKVTDNRTKKTYALKDIISGNINMIASDLKI